MEYEIVRRDGTEQGERVADGHGVIVWVDYGTGRSVPIPDALRAAIREYEGMEGRPDPPTETS
jgi:acyl-CoA thioesterase FadM